MYVSKTVCCITDAGCKCIFGSIRHFFSDSGVSVVFQITASVAYVRNKYCTASGHDDKVPARFSLEVYWYSKAAPWLK